MFAHYTDAQLSDLLGLYPWFAAVRFELVRRGALPNSAIAANILAGATHPRLSVRTPEFQENITPCAQPIATPVAQPEIVDISIPSVTPDDDLVSETLANIYRAQGLNHKAIETYSKLSLKFPEKSAYFALQIQQLNN